MEFKIITFGCKLNQAESDKISADLIMAGLKPAQTQIPDILIINICAVTIKAVRQARQKLNQLKRKYPQVKVVITGCIVERNWPGVDLWVDNKGKDNILKIIKYHKAGKNKDIHLKPSKHRALIKIQTGCNIFCAYCIVPFLRGKPHSWSVKEIISEIKHKQIQGFKEVVLTGINIGLYQKNKVNLVNLLKLILAQTTVQRIRLGSLWPTHINNQLINLYSKNPRLCPHFHLSLQSGSDKILKSMGRNYNSSQIKKIINNCRHKIPKINFTCDIIVGFPCETHQDFQASCKLIKDIGFSKVHVFKYSARPQTKAAKMKYQIEEKIKHQRSQELIKLADKISHSIKKKFINQALDILWETKKAGYWYGFTQNYIRVKNKQVKELDNKIQTIKIKHLA